MKIRILGSASLDLIEGCRFYELQAEGIGDYFLDSLYSDIDSLMVSAGMDAVHFGKYHRLLSKRFPFEPPAKLLDPEWPSKLLASAGAIFQAPAATSGGFPIPTVWNSWFGAKASLHPSDARAWATGRAWRSSAQSHQLIGGQGQDAKHQVANQVSR